MFRKKNKPLNEDDSVGTTVTERVETKGGVIYTTKTTVSTSSGPQDDFESAFKEFNLDPSNSTASYVTKKVVYTSSSGEKQVIEEIKDVRSNHQDSLEFESNKPSKSLAEKLGFKPRTKEAEKESSKAPPSAKSGAFEEDCLKSHNKYRALHGIPPLKLSKQLSMYSKEWADHLAATDAFKHRTERKYGENIYMKWSSDPNHVVGGHEAVDSWYSEIKDHTFGREPTSLKSGHFTQVIWKESTEMGVAFSRSKSGKVLVVANYNPPGNFVGKFTQNVPPPK